MSKYVGFRLGKVHESHVISEYYCGGCGWPVTDHDSFCPECGGAFRECDASNLESDNAKLRELVRDYEHCTMHADCSRCEYDGKISTHCPLSPCFPDADELRELGVEVDE